MWTCESFCRGVKHCFRATIELAITAAASFFPILLGAIVTTCWSDKKLLDSFISNFSYGEVFLYTSAFLAPYAHKKLCKKDVLPSKIIGFFAISSLLLGALVFSFVRLEKILSQEMNIPESAVPYTGWVVVILTLLVWYYSVWGDHGFRRDALTINKAQQENLSTSFDALMGKDK